MNHYLPVSTACMIALAAGLLVAPRLTAGGCPDFDGDGDVDQSDFGHLQVCLTYNGVPQNNPECQDAKLACNPDVGADDLAIFEACMSGPNVLASSGCTLSSPAHYPDFDGDGDVDQSDFGHLQACLTYNGIPQNDPGCQDARLAGNLDVGVGDISIFSECMSGPCVPAAADCTNPPPSYPVFGRVADASGSGVCSVTLSGLPGNPVTDSRGYYVAWVPAGYSGTAVPSLAGCAFSPASRSYSALTSDQAGQDYLAMAVGLPPIARWDVVPYQRINAGETLNCGVVAFSKVGIARVRFSVDGGPPVDVTSMTCNDQSHAYEYWIPISADSFGSDGPILLSAVVEGRDGGTRTLETLTLTVNPRGTLPQPQAWVDAVAGNDSTGQVNNAGAPYATIGRAIAGIADWMEAGGYGKKADGGMVLLNPGSQTMSNGGLYQEIPTKNEWVTIKPAPGGTRANTRIDNADVTPAVRLLKCQDITVQRTAESPFTFQPHSAFADLMTLWIHGCELIGSGRWVEGSGPVGPNVGPRYYTDSLIHDMQDAVKPAEFARGLVISHIGDDAFCQVPMIVNCVVDDLDPGPMCPDEDCFNANWHSDALQWYGGTRDNNVIVYNFRATNLQYQGLFIRGTDGGTCSLPSVGMAFVNVYIDMVSDGIEEAPSAMWYRSVDHLLFWNCSFVDGIRFLHDPYGDGNIPVVIPNLSVKGCEMKSVGINHLNHQIDTSEWMDNHIVCPTAPGGYYPFVFGGYTTQSPMLDSYGRPLTGSPLIGAVNPSLVPADADGRLRNPAADVGSYEH